MNLTLDLIKLAAIWQATTGHAPTVITLGRLQREQLMREYVSAFNPFNPWTTETVFARSRLTALERSPASLAFMEIEWDERLTWIDFA